MIGKVFNADGRVAGIVAPAGEELTERFPEEISFRVLRTRDGTDQYPAWTDILVDGRIKLRINPSLIEFPHFRLYDAVFLVGRQYEDIPASPMKAQVEFGGQQFLLWREKLRDGEIAVMDTVDRIEQWNPGATQRGKVQDGQWRIKSKNRK